MFYRRKIILALLQTFEGKLKKIDFQKLLFLLSTKQKKPSFNFVPYKYGCFSFQSYADIRTMIKYHQIEEKGDENDFRNYWIKLDKDDYIHQLRNEDLINLKLIKQKFGNYSSNELIKYTYLNYPFYTINSTIASKILTNKELMDVNQVSPALIKNTLFTIGYEGISLEEYLNKLLTNNVKVLCDVRKNPVSMKYGFSKKQLKNACEGIGIEYVHLPDLGIVSKHRQNLVSQKDYDNLFKEYHNTVLKNNDESLNKILKLLKINHGVALTCFENNINQCHRKQISDKLFSFSELELEIRHI